MRLLSRYASSPPDRPDHSGRSGLQDQLALINSSLIIDFSADMQEKNHNNLCLISVFV
jgi:hypothetical protein